VVHPETFKGAEAGLTAGPERGFLEWLKTSFGEPLATSRELKHFWRTDASKTGLLYFYCHANATKLALADDDKIEASKLFLLLTNGQFWMSRSAQRLFHCGR
jgi:hypothetical protein